MHVGSWRLFHRKVEGGSSAGNEENTSRFRFISRSCRKRTCLQKGEVSDDVFLYICFFPLFFFLKKEKNLL